MTRRGWPRQLGRQDTKVDATTIHLEGQARSSEGESRMNGRGGAVGPAALGKGGVGTKVLGARPCHTQGRAAVGSAACGTWAECAV